MEFKHHLEFESTKELEEEFHKGNYELSKVIIDTALKNLKTKDEEMPVTTITTKDSDVIYDIILERKDLIETLEQNLPIMEKFEEYEYCQKIVDAIKYLKTI